MSRFLWLFHGLGMNPRICRCCGEAIAEHGDLLSRNPNLCAFCSSMIDGMDAGAVPPPNPDAGAMAIESQPVYYDSPSSMVPSSRSQ